MQRSSETSDLQIHSVQSLPKTTVPVSVVVVYPRHHLIGTEFLGGLPLLDAISVPFDVRVLCFCLIHFQIPFEELVGYG